jgi:hypothetical protein
MSVIFMFSARRAAGGDLRAGAPRPRASDPAVALIATPWGMCPWSAEFFDMDDHSRPKAGIADVASARLEAAAVLKG